MSDDLIRRSDAIKSLNDYLGDCYRVSRHKYEKTMLDAISMDFEAVITNIPSVEPKQEWIPCSERLPEKDKEVLVYLWESPYIAWIYDGEWHTEEFNVDKDDEPIAWMPLLEPYRE